MKIVSNYQIDNHEEHPRNNQARDKNVPRNHEDYITQVYSNYIEGRVTKKLSQELSKTQSFILGARSKLDEFLLKPLARVYSGAVLESSRNSNTENQESNENRSQIDPFAEVGVYLSQPSQEFSPDEIFPILDLLNQLLKRMKKCKWFCRTQTKFADDGNRRPYLQSWRLSTCGSEKVKLTKCTKKCHPKDLKTCLKAYRYQEIDIELYLQQTIFPNRTA